MGRGKGLIAGGMALACVLSISAPVSASEAPVSMRNIDLTPSPTFDELKKLQGRRSLESLGAPRQLINLFEDIAEQGSVETDRFMWAQPSRDLNGDGSDEVLEITYILSVGSQESQDEVTISEKMTTILRVRSGRSGKLLWKKKWDDLTFFADSRFGQPAEPAILAIAGWFSFFSTSATSDFVIGAHAGDNGKTIWENRYPVVQDMTGTVNHDVPLSIASYQGVKGGAQDLVVGFGEVTYALFTYAVAARTIVIDGRDGTGSQHPTIDVAVNWIPSPDPTGDLDADGLDDYVVTLPLGFDVGSGQGPPTVGGTAYARKGNAGTPIWTSSGMDFHDFAWVRPLPNVMGGEAPDLGIRTPEDPEWNHQRIYMLDGDTGRVEWLRRGEGVWSPGDVNRDGHADLSIGRTNITSKAMIHTINLLTGNGKLILKKRITWEPKIECRVPCLFRAWGWGWGAIGDADRDGISDTGLWLGASGSMAGEDSRDFVISTRTVKILLEDQWLYPVGSVDGRGIDVIRLEVSDGKLETDALRGDTGDRLWSIDYGFPKKVLREKKSWAYPSGLDIGTDHCKDVLLLVGAQNIEGLVVIDGKTARPLWGRWQGAKKDRPALTRVESSNPC